MFLPFFAGEMPGESFNSVLLRTLNRNGVCIVVAFVRLWTFCEWRGECSQRSMRVVVWVFLSVTTVAW
jgi:hypothetical protein